MPDANTPIRTTDDCRGGDAMTRPRCAMLYFWGAAPIVGLALTASLANAELKLSAIESSGTDGPKRTELYDAKKTVKTVNLTVHGSGFATGPSARENEITVDGKKQKVNWEDH